MVPNTYLLTAPDKAANLLGNGMLSADMIRGLRQLNNNVVIPDPDSYGWYPGKAAGMTCLWYGKPSCPGSKKVCAFHLGEIPEFTQIAPDGDIIAKGWREIFKRVVDRTPIRQAQLERKFRVNLSRSGNVTLCIQCTKEGVRESHNGGQRHLCDLHDSVRDAVDDVMQEVEETRYNNRRGPRTPRPTTVIKAVK